MLSVVKEEIFDDAAAALSIAFMVFKSVTHLWDLSNIQVLSAAALGSRESCCCTSVSRPPPSKLPGFYKWDVWFRSKIDDFHRLRIINDSITEKVSFNIASEASYVYILSGQKLIKNAKDGQFQRVFENQKLAVKQCYQIGQF